MHRRYVVWNSFHLKTSLFWPLTHATNITYTYFVVLLCEGSIKLRDAVINLFGFDRDWLPECYHFYQL